MSQQVFNTFLISQLVVQSALYLFGIRFLHKQLAQMLPSGSITFKTLSALGFIENIAISIGICYFTNSGAMAGTANILASTFVGLLISVDSVWLSFMRHLQIKKETKNER